VQVGSVFLSRPSEMARFPAGRSFAQAAMDALREAGWDVVEMTKFPSSDEDPIEHVKRQVDQCDLYVGVIGFRYGEIVPDRDISYTELEFDTATERDKPRLLFLLDESLRTDARALPRDMIAPDRGRVDAFRQRIRRTRQVKQFTTPANLEKAVRQALLDEERRARVPRRPWMVPPRSGPVVDRPELVRTVMTALTSPGDDPVGLTTGLEGPPVSSRPRSPPRCAVSARSRSSSPVACCG
jgi:Domain of unknown function (DUF4062)